jgi:hypothetical protein
VKTQTSALLWGSASLLFALSAGAQIPPTQTLGQRVARNFYLKLPPSQAQNAKVTEFAAVLDRFCTTQDLERLLNQPISEANQLSERCAILMPHRASSEYNELNEIIFLLGSQESMDSAYVDVLKKVCSPSDVTLALQHAANKLGFNTQALPLAHISTSCIAAVPFLNVTTKAAPPSP